LALFHFWEFASCQLFELFAIFIVLALAWSTCSVHVLPDLLELTGENF